MSETPYNPDDPAFLADRALYEELPDDRRRQLEEALSSSKSLREEAQDLRAVERLLEQWGDHVIDVDWNAFPKVIRERIASQQDEGDLRKVDDLLSRWGGTEVRIDPDRFTNAVISEIRTQDRTRSRRVLIFRIGIPLAAAAAIAIMVTASFWPPASRDAVCEVVLGPIARSAEVVYERANPRRKTASARTNGVSFLAVGWSAPPTHPTETGLQDCPPI